MKYFRVILRDKPIKPFEGAEAENPVVRWLGGGSWRDMEELRVTERA